MAKPVGLDHGAGNGPLPCSDVHPIAPLGVACPGAGGIHWFKPAGGKKVHLSWEAPAGLRSKPLCRASEFRMPDSHRGTGFEQVASCGDLCDLCSARYCELLPVRPSSSS